jgi:hypothetical protein
MNRRSSGLIFVAICVAALALRLLLPAGWMPVATGNGGMAITLCSGAVLPTDPGPPAPGDDQRCGFGLRQMARHHRARPPGQGPPFA